MVSVHGNKDYLCDKCDYSSTTENLFKQHFRNHHLGIFIKCDQCDKQFSEQRYLKTHIKSIHEKIEMVECDLCDLKFKECKS